MSAMSITTTALSCRRSRHSTRKCATFKLFIRHDFTDAFMSSTIRDLSIEDRVEVNSLCETIWNGNDYIPERFPEWIEDINSYPLGMFVNGSLVALGTLECIPESDVAWVMGLRVREGHRQHGLGSEIIRHLVAKADELGIQTLWYATSSRNEASIRLAEKAGFRFANSTGYFRLEPPFPPHPKPSPNIHPLEVDALRLYEIIQHNPELIKTETFPVAWEFYRKTEPDLKRLSTTSKMRAVVEENGETAAIYISETRFRNNTKTMTYTMYSGNRTVFVDVMARILDELTEAHADSAAFFLGPNVEEWARFAVEIPNEFENRRFLLYERRST
ncbi:MAG: GNAT family N-acetyltransferase [Candidatus Thorarchaeota archaeon]|nr:GNAT family N-acetyltransferase [Candidatus Thorarchaeota archaeon]